MRTRTGAIERRKFFQLHLVGQSYAQIAEQYGVSAICVRKWCRRQREGGGVEDRYYNPRAGVLSQFSAELGRRIEAIKREHPDWGPESILLHLRKEREWQGQKLPSCATIGRYLHTFAEFRRKPKKKLIEIDLDL
jgi:transposase